MFMFEALFSGDSRSLHVPEGLFAETENEKEIRRGLWRKPRRILSVQASPRKESGATDVVLSHLLAGMASADSTVEKVYLADLEVKPCLGCFTCWKSDQGRCVHRDSMDTVLPKIPETDLLVLATPLYFNGMPGTLKMFLDRLLPLGHPYIFSRSGRCRHPARHSRMPNLVLAAVCGFYEKSNFDPLLRHIISISENTHTPLLASILRPAAMTLLDERVPGPRSQVLEAIERGGKKLLKKDA